jgi:hypothetical protein
VTHLLHAEDGPFNAAASLRRLAGNSFLGHAMACFCCLSLWISLPVALLMNAGVAQFLLLWPTVSGAACLLEQATSRENSPALIYEETKQ